MTQQVKAHWGVGSFNLALILFILFMLMGFGHVQGQAINTIPEITYAQLSTCSAGSLRDVYVKDSQSDSSCGPGSGLYRVRCSCAWNALEGSYQWRPTKAVIGATGGSGSDQASDIQILDEGGYYSSGSVEGALQELGIFVEDHEDGVTHFTELQDVGSLTANRLLVYSGGTVSSYGGFATNTGNFSSTITLSGKDFCLEDGTNCPPNEGGATSFTQLSDVDSGVISSSGRMLVWDGSKVISSSRYDYAYNNWDFAPTVTSGSNRVEICLEDGTNCPSGSGGVNNFIELEDVNASLGGTTGAQVLVWNGDADTVDYVDYTTLCKSNGVNCPSAGATALDNLSDVEISSPLAHEVLSYDGESWVNNTISLLDLSDFTPGENTNRLSFWNGSALVPYLGYRVDTHNFIAIPKINGKEICLEDGTNCESVDLSESSLNDLFDVEISDFTEGNILRLNGEGVWESSIFPTINFRDLGEVKSEDFDSVDLKILSWDPIEERVFGVESVGSYSFNSNSFTSSPIFEGKEVCLEDGTNCPAPPEPVDTLNDLTDVTLTSSANGDYLGFNGSAWVNVDFPAIPELPDSEGELEALIGVSVFTTNDGALNDDNLANNNINDLANVEASSTNNYVMVYDGTDSRWESRPLVSSDIPSLALSKTGGAAGSQMVYTDTSGTLSSMVCPPNSVLVSSGDADLPECVSVGNQPTVQISNDTFPDPLPLQAITVVNQAVDGEAFIYEDETGTLQIDADKFAAQITGCTIENLSEPPDNGCFQYYDTDMHDLCVFDGGQWTGSLTGSACAVVTFNLAVTIVEDDGGTGSVSSSPGGITGCTTGTCNHEFDEDEVVTLTATPDSGMQFDGWSGDSDCSDGSVTMISDISCSATFSIIPSGGSATNWSSNLLAYWTMDENNLTRVSSGTCGTTCNLFQFPNPPATVANSTSIKVFGTASAFVDSSSSNVQRFGCMSDTQCTTLRTMNSGSTMGNVSMGGWIRRKSTARSQNIIFNSFDGGTTGGGIKVYYTSDGTVYAQLYTSSSVSITLGGTDACAVDTWCYVAITFDDSTKTAKLYIDGILKDTDTGLTGGINDANTGKFFRACGTSDAPTKFDGYCDDMWVSEKALTSDQICRICQSGVTGEGGVCNGSNATLYNSVQNSCGSCTPSACNASAP